MSFKNTIEKAYGNVPKDPATNVGINMDWIPTYRGIRYYWIKLIRSLRKVK